jgi:DNA-binding PadR family transcriptional regulator
MTPLKLLILKLLAQRGPMRDVELWQHTTELTIETVTRACLALKADGYIQQQRGLRPVSLEYQLTENGVEYIAVHLVSSSSAGSANA